MIKNFTEHMLDLLLESISKQEIRLFFSSRLRKILVNIRDTYHNNIATKLLVSEDSEFRSKISYVDLHPSGDDMVSFIIAPKAIELIIKDNEYSEYGDVNFSDYYDYLSTDSIVYIKNRTPIKIGKLVKKLFGDSEFKNSGEPGKDIESFVNMFKSYRDESKFEIVSNDDIKHWYNESNYISNRGTLGNSCMRYSNCDDYFDFYIKNNVKMLILKDVQDDTKIRGRALIWELNVPEGRTFMDRVYYSSESDVELFKQYAIKNKWLYKKTQNSNDFTMVVDPNDNSENYINMRIDNILPNDYYPYLDTLCYYDPEYKRLSNSIDTMIIGDYYILRSTGGDYETNGIYVDYYGQSFNEDSLTWCEYGDTWRLDGDYFWSNRYRSNIANDYADDNMVWCEYGDDYVESGEEIEVRDGDFMVPDYEGDDIRHCTYNDEYIRTADSVWSDYYNSYLYDGDSIEVYLDSDKYSSDYRIIGDGTYYRHDNGDDYDNGVELDEIDEENE